MLENMLCTKLSDDLMNQNKVKTLFSEKWVGPVESFFYKFPHKKPHFPQTVHALSDLTLFPVRHAANTICTQKYKNSESGSATDIKQLTF